MVLCSMPILEDDCYSLCGYFFSDHGSCSDYQYVLFVMGAISLCCSALSFKLQAAQSRPEVLTNLSTSSDVIRARIDIGVHHSASLRRLEGEVFLSKYSASYVRPLASKQDCL